MKEMTFVAKDGKEIFYRCWDDVDRERGVVQIAHGMAEHCYRYDYLAKKLNENGFVVYANDHRGHGYTEKDKSNLGYYADENGWHKVRDDMKTLTDIIKEKHNGSNLFLFGHSMGSFLSRAYIQNYGKELTGVILSGTGGNPGIIGKIGKMIADGEVKKKGPKHRSEKMDKMSFGKFNNEFKPNKTEFDWLSRDEKEVEKYIKDEFCGFLCTSKFFSDLLGGIIEINKKENILNIPKNLPIFLISGDKDPVGGNKKGVLQAYISYADAKIEDVSYKFYKDARHEIMNEINKEEVIVDVVNWINSHNIYE